jgi:DNA-binding CsgD family transcriptional regulator
VAVVGRVSEREAIDGLLAEAGEGLSAALVLYGEPGIGKTTLLDAAAAAAGDRFRVCRVVGFESERDLAFAAVHRLVLPFLPRIARLPRRQRAAIESAFGLNDGPPPADRFLVGLATLSLLASAAGTRPLLCLIDDAQWLDDESIAALAFAARRLQADRIVMLFAVRDSDRDGLPLEGLPSLRVDGLPVDEARELLQSVISEPLDVIVADRVVADTRGSPLALVELAGELTAAQIASGAINAEPFPIGRRLEDHFLRQVRALPAETQRLLLIASAEGSGDRAVVTSAAELLAVEPEAAEPAEVAGLLTSHPTIGFRHPLVRAAVYGAATTTERRRTHEALAAAAAGAADQDRQAWHLGLAADRPDEAVASQLEEAAGRALRRGGCAAAAAFYTRAAELSTDRRGRVERALSAAQRHLVAGFRIRARHVLAELAPDIDDPQQRARAAAIEGAIRYAIGDTAETVTILVEAAKALRPFDVHRARDALLQALAAARVTGVFTAPGESEIDVALAARAMPLPPGSRPTIGDLFLDGDATLFLDGHAAAVPQLQRALAAVENDPSDSEEMLRWLGIGCWAAGALADDEQLHRLATRLELAARRHGAVVPLSIGLMFLGVAELFQGAVAAARDRFAERAELLDAIGSTPDVGPLLAMAWTGTESAVRAEATAVTARARDSRHGWMLVFVDYALTVLELGLGDYAAAFTTAAKNHLENPFLSVAAFPNVIEAAIRSGERAAAEDALLEFSRRALISSTPLTSGLVACGRALLADDAHAEGHYVEALRRLRSVRGALPRARAHLLYGEWLRRRNRRVDARRELRTAHELFTAIGAVGFAERAWRELAATGERARRRSLDAGNELTPQELRIAQLAAVGATNPEIANKLYLSASTVDYHLRKVYRKLDVSSRRQLSKALPA